MEYKSKKRKSKIENLEMFYEVEDKGIKVFGEYTTFVS